MSDRAVSTVVSYVLVLGIVAILLSALTVSFVPLVANQQGSAVHTTLKVLGNDVAGDVETADRLTAAAGDDGEVVLRTRLPDRIEGSTYEIEIEQVDDGEERYRGNVTLRSVDHDLSVTVQFRTRAEIELEEDTLDGGTLEIRSDGERLVIANG